MKSIFFSVSLIARKATKPTFEMALQSHRGDLPENWCFFVKFAEIPDFDPSNPHEYWAPERRIRKTLPREGTETFYRIQYRIQY